MNKLFKRILSAALIACCTVSVFSMTACNEGKDYSDDFTKLQQEIDNLKNENNSLKDQISSITPSDKDYTEEIERLQQQLESLKSENSSNLAEIEKLQQEIEILKQTSTNELKTYKIGETYTFNYRDTYIFSITLETRTKLVVKNIKSPAPLKIIDFIQIQKVGLVEGITSSSAVILDDKKLKVGTEYVKDLIALSDTYDLKAYFGIPLSNNSVLPYAVFDLTSSV